jgi:hypothetical protein
MEVERMLLRVDLKEIEVVLEEEMIEKTEDL